MMETIILLGSLLLVFAAGWFAVDRLFGFLDPEEASGRQYRFMTDNVTVLRPMMQYFDPKNCVLFTGGKEEIRDELARSSVDFAVMESSSSDSAAYSSSLNHLRASYQPSEPVSAERGMRFFLLTSHIRSLDIYYTDTMKPFVQRLLGSRIITKIG